MNKASSSDLYKLVGMKNRRDFLKYMVGSAIASLGMGYLFPQASYSREVDLETLCSLYPYNSRCENYLPGVLALDDKGNQITVNALKDSATPGVPIMVKGLPNNSVDYLVIDTGPIIANYAIKPVCTHLGCTVNWNRDQNQFICPCHGSKYDNLGRVVHGPAKRSLPLITVVVKQNQVRLVDQKPAIDPRPAIN